MTIDARRWTANEREVVTDALLTERERQKKRRKLSRAALVRSDVQWRLVVIDQTLEAIGEP